MESLRNHRRQMREDEQNRREELQRQREERILRKQNLAKSLLQKKLAEAQKLKAETEALLKERRLRQQEAHDNIVQRNQRSVTHMLIRSDRKKKLEDKRVHALNHSMEVKIGSHKSTISDSKDVIQQLQQEESRLMER
eukprot:CAMPEP_0115038394 /NCGR_PEP_ID=MMETSP0216-20121206/43384_1 /TAXON_ID=223996 /ORGANISM="Protocruzia adherens, Strain Boccale" /LENGTH=137 /DNA_ID=CAMNT_0002418789 /DNA_START=206 /DNA_END=615 /DNA_ORIENTATION=-